MRAISLWLLFAAISFGDIRDAIKPGEDATKAIQADLDEADRYCKVPNGEFRLDATVFLNSDSCLELSPRTKLVRNGSSTAPLIHITANHVTLIGNRGWLKSSNAQPLGFVHVGPRDPVKVANINWTMVDGLVFEGNATEPAKDSVGLYLSSSQPTAGSGSNYNGLFRGNVFKFLERGIYCGPVCNAHTFEANFFYRQTKYSYHFVGCTESSVGGGFTHLSTMEAVIKAERCGYVLFSNVQAEPGSGVLFDFDKDCKAMCFWGHDNTGKSPTDNGQNTTFFSHGWLRTDKITTRQK